MVYARRIGREESAVKRALATAFYKLMERLARVPYQGQAGDFRLMSRRVVDAVRQMPERRRFLRGMVAWVGLRAGADRVPARRARGGPRRVLPGAVPAGPRGARRRSPTCRWPGRPTSGIVTAALSAVAALRACSCSRQRRAGDQRDHVDARRRAVPRRRAARQRSASSAAIWRASTRRRCTGRCTWSTGSSGATDDAAPDAAGGGGPARARLALWFWPLLIGDQLGQSYNLWFEPPWAALQAGRDPGRAQRRGRRGRGLPPAARGGAGTGPRGPLPGLEPVVLRRDAAARQHPDRAVVPAHLARR